MSQEFGHDLAGPSVKGSTRLQPKYWLGCILTGDLTGKNLFPSSFKSAGLISLRMYYWRPRLLTGCWLEASHSSLPNGFLNMAACFIKTVRRISHSSLLGWSLIWCDVNVGVTSHHYCHVLFSRSKSKVSTAGNEVRVLRSEQSRKSLGWSIWFIW